MVPRPHYLGTKLRMHYLTVDSPKNSNEEKVAVVVSVASIKIKATGSRAMFALRFSTFL